MDGQTDGQMSSQFPRHSLHYAYALYGKNCQNTQSIWTDALIDQMCITSSHNASVELGFELENINRRFC